MPSVLRHIGNVERDGVTVKTLVIASVCDACGSPNAPRGYEINGKRLAYCMDHVAAGEAAYLGKMRAA